MAAPVAANPFSRKQWFALMNGRDKPSHDDFGLKARHDNMEP
jgi:hypothetical protein